MVELSGFWACLDLILRVSLVGVGRVCTIPLSAQSRVIDLEPGEIVYALWFAGQAPHG